MKIKLKLKAGDLMLLCEDTAVPSCIKLVKVLTVKNEYNILTAKVESGKEPFWTYASMLYPLECEQELLDITIQRAQFKASFDASLNLVFKLRNKITFEI